MAGKTTTACTHEQYETIIKTLYEGIGDCVQPNPRIATILVIEANVGLRIGDTLSLRRSSFIKTPSGHAFNIIEHKTGKVRRFKVQEQVYNFLLEYADSEGIEGDDLIFPIGVRAVQKHLKKVCDWLGPELRIYPPIRSVNTSEQRFTTRTERTLNWSAACISTVPPPLRLVTWVLRTKRLNRH